MKKHIIFILVIILSLGTLAGCFNGSDTVDEDLDENVLTDWSTTVYFSDDEGMNLVKEYKTFKVENSAELTLEDKALIILEELIKASNKESYWTSIPEETKILGAELSENIITVNLSREFEEDHIGGTTGILMSIGPIVMSLTELEGIDKVMFRIEGEPVKDFKGHIQLNKEFEREEYEQYVR